jgi:hypothetical protein
MHDGISATAVGPGAAGPAHGRLDDSEPANADLMMLTRDTPISCRDDTFPECIDHIVVERRVAPWVDRTSFRHVTDRQAGHAV